MIKNSLLNEKEANNLYEQVKFNISKKEEEINLLKSNILICEDKMQQEKQFAMGDIGKMREEILNKEILVKEKNDKIVELEKDLQNKENIINKLSSELDMLSQRFDSELEIINNKFENEVRTR